MLISAPTADVAAAAYAVPGALAAFCGLEEILDRNASEASNWLIVLTVIGATLLKLKLSYSVLGGAAIGIAAVGLIFIQGREFYRTWARTTILAVVLFIPWAARGLILTGYPFYPSAFVRFRTDWTVPKKTADSDRDWICAWAKSPNKGPKDVLHDDAWLAPWVERNAKDPQNIFLFLFVTAGLLSTLISLSIPMSRERRFLNVLIKLPSALALVLWFATAPDPRFGYGALLLFGVNGFYAAGSALAQILLTRAAFFTCVVTADSFLLIFRNELPLISRFPKAFPQGFPKAELVYKTTASGLRVGVASEQAWDSGLVVTPNFKPSLALRGVGLRDGFRIK
jgi:hypothetical protein